MKSRYGMLIAAVKAAVVTFSVFALSMVTVVAIEPAASAAVAAHAPIFISQDSDFSTCHCVNSGSGTPGDPYIGGGGPANLNGNSWSANTATFVAPCIPAQ